MTQTYEPAFPIEDLSHWERNPSHVGACEADGRPAGGIEGTGAL